MLKLRSIKLVLIHEYCDTVAAVFVFAWPDMALGLFICSISIDPNDTHVLVLYGYICSHAVCSTSAVVEYVGAEAVEAGARDGEAHEPAAGAARAQAVDAQAARLAAPRAPLLATRRRHASRLLGADRYDYE